jgi:hypothetical protein
LLPRVIRVPWHALPMAAPLMSQSMDTNAIRPRFCAFAGRPGRGACEAPFDTAGATTAPGMAAEVQKACSTLFRRCTLSLARWLFFSHQCARSRRSWGKP